MTGKGTIQYADGLYYKGEFKDGKFEGEGELTDKDKKKT